MPAYEIKPTSIAVETSFAKFTQSMSSCGPIKYSVSTPNAGVQAILGVVGSTNSNLVRTTAKMTFEDSATTIRL